MARDIVRRLVNGIWRTEDVSSDGGGGSQPTGHQELSGSPVAIAATDFARLTWDTSNGPDSLLDLSTPAHPTVLAAGVYIVSVEVTPATALAATDYFDVLLQFDRNGFNASQVQSSPSGTAVLVQPHVTISWAWYVPLGGLIEVGVTWTPADGSTGNSFNLENVHVQQVSA